MIESYDFGRIVINGRSYTSDLIVFPSHVKDNWWRKEGHRLSVDDLEEVFKATPEVLVVGTGYYGLMKVPEEVKEHLAKKGIKLIVKQTIEACETFNDFLRSGKKVVAALHLTC